jgi:hypothetical protein
VSTIAERVAAGVSWLDWKLPGWWESHRIDLDLFDMTGDCRCVVGQLSPHHHYGKAVSRSWLDLDEEMATEFGFWAGVAEFSDNVAHYRALEAEWRRVIEARRSS